RQDPAPGGAVRDPGRHLLRARAVLVRRLCIKRPHARRPALAPVPAALARPRHRRRLHRLRGGPAEVPPRLGQPEPPTGVPLPRKRAAKAPARRGVFRAAWEKTKMSNRVSALTAGAALLSVQGRTAARRRRS